MLATLERDFLTQLLAAKARPDGRAVDAPQPLSLAFAEEGFGSVEVQLGATRVAARLEAQLAPPRNNGSEGFLRIHTTYFPVANEAWRPLIPGHTRLFLDAFLEKAILRARAIDLESLAVVGGSVVWALDLHVSVLADGGSLPDAMLYAAMAALLHFRRPDVSVDDDKVSVVPVDVRPPVPLTLRHLPHATTFMLFAVWGSAGKLATTAQVPKEVLCYTQPTEEESRVGEGHLVVAVNGLHETCVLSHMASVSLSSDQLYDAVAASAKRAMALDEQLRKQVSADIARKMATGKYATAVTF